MWQEESGKRVWLRVPVAILLILALVVTACAPAATPAPSPTEAEPAVEEPVVEEPVAEEPAVEERDYYYDPDLAGEEINVVWYEGPGTIHARPFVQPFIEETGIKVNIIEIPESGIIEKQVLDFTGQAGAYDVIQTTMDGASVAYYASAGWLEDLDPYLEKTSAAYNYEADFQESIQAATSYPFGGVPKIPEAHTYAIMQELTTRIMIYREDLFNDANEQEAFEAKYGRELRVPETMDELLEVAEFFTRPEDNLYGIAFDGARDVHLYANYIHFLWALGGDEFDPSTMEVTLDTPEGVAAAEYILELAQYTPPGFSTSSLVETATSFAQGQAAMCLLWAAAYSLAAGPDAAVHGKVGSAEIPGATRYIIAGVGMGINKFSKSQSKKDAAWSFISYITSPSVQIEMQKEGNPGPRKSVYTIESIAEATPAENLGTRLGSEKGYPWTMASSVGTQLVDIIFTNLHRAIAGEVSAEKAMEDADAEATQLFKDAGLTP